MRLPAALCLLMFGGLAFADDMPTFRVELKDGTLTPTRIVAPAKTKFRIEVINTGKTPAEFESLPLRKEKVLAPGVKSSVVVMGASPGEYPFFDDFHPQARGVIVVK
ncbi:MULTISPECIES: cupredoxin domain-containing protein [Microvirgula]|uniref:Cupredoxin domain-containing protein n=1 Tax=Microvirgula aerodenitrificans TaxID=57480 RepID=A0A2S0P9V2_9NEIS|nr:MULTISPECIES: cupredoxin domain-containing protein [Microvirgula]AVY94057.1 cupredoxin domain-containing protein [Microvirgula aerodenitrificans]RAS13835.1 hypothetical protein DFO50_11248 [Microvirgula sp. AG722]